MEVSGMNDNIKIEEIDRRSNLTRREFVDEYQRPNKPVIFTDLTKDWIAREKYTLDYFRSEHGDRVAHIEGTPYKLGDYIDLLEKATVDNPAPYPCKLDLREDFKDLVKDVQPRPAVMYPDRTHSKLIPRRFVGGLADLEIFFGGPGSKFPYLHYDYLGLYAFIHQMHGDKEFTVYAPDQQEFLYVKKDEPWISEMENHQSPDLEKYPLYAQAKGIKFVAHAGETLFIPKLWYHTARSLTPTISVASDQLCHFNWDIFVKECTEHSRRSPLKAVLAKATLIAAGLALDIKERLQGGL
jgi:histone arginine demethylase JMJD6